MAFLRPGQEVRVSITAYDPQIYGTLKGKLERIGADTIEDDRGEVFFEVDVRTEKEVQQQPVFPNSINIPMQELPERFSEIPTDKPILVSCASGYRSAIASSMIKQKLPDAEVVDMSETVTEFLKPEEKK